MSNIDVTDDMKKVFDSLSGTWSVDDSYIKLRLFSGSLSVRDLRAICKLKNFDRIVCDSDLVNVLYLAFNKA